MRSLILGCGLICLMVAEVWLVIAALSRGAGSLADAVVLICAHVLVTTAFAWLAAPGRGRTHQRAAAFIAVAGGFVPVIGLLGATVVLRFAAKPGAEQASLVCRRFELESYAEQQAPSRPTSVSASRLRAVIASRGEPSERIAAILAAGSLGARNAIALYKIALRDPVDEVRLLAFAKLEGHRRNIESRIVSMRTVLEAPSDDRGAASVHHRLAEAHDELAYLGLVEGDALRDALAHAAEHARIASTSVGVRRGSVFFTLGRVLLRAGALGQAQRAFERAREFGVSPGKTAPYAAEIAFQSRSFARESGAPGLVGSMRGNPKRFNDHGQSWR